MSSHLQLSLGVTPRLELRISPQLVLSTRMLALSTVDLLGVVEEELAENPALERDETSSSCSWCMDPRCTGQCRSIEHLLERGASAGSSRELSEERARETPCRVSPPEELLREVGLLLPERDRLIAGCLIGSMDEHGLLDASVEDVAQLLGVDPSRVAPVLRSIQEVGPPGIGARDTRECLLLQLDRMQEESSLSPIVRSIISEHLPELGECRFAAIAGALGVDEAQVGAARDFIRKNLRPYPASDFVTRTQGIRASEAIPLLPDVIIRRSASCPERFEVEVVEALRLQLRVSAAYGGISNHLSRMALSPEEQRHIESCMIRARGFITRLRQRWETMTRVTEYLAEYQREFLLHGPLCLRPLTLAQAAEELGLHESTLSRATSNKFAMVPDGRVVSLRRFFQKSDRVHELLKQLIAGEESPLSDADLALEARRHGIQIARRTVAKYRSQLGILPQRTRTHLSQG